MYLPAYDSTVRARRVLAALCLAAPLASASAALAQDSDADGVPDAVDTFPCDATSSAESYAPAVGTHGLILSEDFWPSRNDDDYQDAVIAYNYAFKLNAAGNVSYLRATYDVLAAGGDLDLGLGLRLPVAASAPRTISATLDGQPLALTNGSDPNLTQVVISSLREQLFPGSSSIINARADTPATSNAGVVEVIIRFDPPVSLPIGRAPFDLYIFRASAPDHEIHLSQYCGTAGMNTALFGTGIDASARPNGPCFVDAQGLPSMINIPQVISYPIERTPISALYPNIVAWAASGGATNANWFQSANASYAYPNALVPDFNGSAQLDIVRSCACPAGYTGTAGLCVASSGSAAFEYTGAVQTFVVPSGVNSVVIDAYGAQGASSSNPVNSGVQVRAGGNGGRATGRLAVTPGETLYVYVGGQNGFNGGGAGGYGTYSSNPPSGYAGNGGGATDVRRGGQALANRVIVAGGGGGAGRHYINGSCQPCGIGGTGGAGGGIVGTDGVDGTTVAGNRGRGAGQSAGGAGGFVQANGGVAGAQGNGGAGASGRYSVAGGGGGGGFFGGGGGGGASDGSGVAGGGGGGGASYIGGLSSATTTAGARTGQGRLTITWP